MDVQKGICISNDLENSILKMKAVCVLNAIII